jgi:hypothetical protein
MLNRIKSYCQENYNFLKDLHCPNLEQDKKLKPGLYTGLRLSVYQKTIIHITYLFENTDNLYYMYLITKDTTPEGLFELQSNPLDFESLYGVTSLLTQNSITTDQIESIITSNLRMKTNRRKTVNGTEKLFSPVIKRDPDDINEILNSVIQNQ